MRFRFLMEEYRFNRVSGGLLTMLTFSTCCLLQKSKTISANFVCVFMIVSHIYLTLTHTVITFYPTPIPVLK